MSVVYRQKGLTTSHFHTQLDPFGSELIKYKVEKGSCHIT